MKFKIFLNLLFLLITTHNVAQESINKSEMTDFSNFNIQQFNQQRGENRSLTYQTEDGTEVTDEFISQKSGYHRKVKSKNNPLIEYYRFDQNEQIRTRGSFHVLEFNVGVWKFYDEQGHLTKSKDWNEGYVFNWESILEFLKQQEVDLNSIHTHVRKTTENDAPVWEVSYLIELPYLRDLVLSAKDGSILKETKTQLRKCSNH